MPDPSTPARPSVPTCPSSDPALYESQHVHAVYQVIAPHFSATRHSPWPRVESFLASQRPGAVGFDLGCGNGKYLGLITHISLIGCDRSEALVRLAKDGRVQRAGGDDVLVADSLALPFGTSRGDFAICVAVLHHFSTEERRREGMREALGCVKRGQGRLLVLVWALEQKSSRRGWHEGGEQDLLVPWVLKRPRPRPREGEGKRKGKDKGEGGAADEKGAEDDKSQRPAEDSTGATEPKQSRKNDGVYRRYYHLYRKGELEEDVLSVGGQVLESGYDQDNWWVVAAPP